MWSAGFKSLVAYVHNRFSRKLMFVSESMSMSTEKLPAFNQAVNKRLITRARFIPGPGEDTIAGLLDCTSIAVTKPQDRLTASAHQTGYKEGYNVKALTVQWPDGMIGGLHVCAGRRSDCYQMRDSGVADIMEAMSIDVTGQGTVMSLYGDAIFSRVGFVKGPNRIDSNGSGWSAAVLNDPANRVEVERLRQQDEAMVTARLPVENSYGGFKGELQMLTHKRKLSTSNRTTTQLIPFCLFVHNCKCCCQGNNVSAQFGLTPPVLEEYTAKLEAID